MHIIPDTTIIFQLIIFLAVFLALSLLVFRPLKRLLAYRERHTNGYLEKASGLNEKAARKKGEYLKKMEGAKVIGHKLKEEIRQRALKEEEEIKSKARRLAEERLIQAEAELEAARSAAWSSLEKTAPRLAEEIVKGALE